MNYERIVKKLVNILDEKYDEIENEYNELSKKMDKVLEDVNKNGIHELKDLSFCLGRMKMLSDIRGFVIEMITKEFGEGDDLK